jgi:hypothetical protein
MAGVSLVCLLFFSHSRHALSSFSFSDLPTEFGPMTSHLMPRSIIHSNVSVDPESESKALSIAPEAEDLPMTKTRPRESGKAGGKVRMRTRIEMGMNVKRVTKRTRWRRKVKRLTSPRRKKETKGLPTTGQRCSAGGAQCTSSSTKHLNFAANSLRPQSPRRQCRQRPCARHDSRSRSSCPHRLTSPCTPRSIHKDKDLDYDIESEDDDDPHRADGKRPVMTHQVVLTGIVGFCWVR